MAAQTYSDPKNSPENFHNNSFNKKGSLRSFKVLAGDDTRFKIENRTRPAWLQESTKSRPTAEGFAIYQNRAFRVLQSKLQK